MTTTGDAGRRRHYRRFYETDPPGDELVVVVGNCQAESIRLLLDPDDVRTVRVPPVFEMEAEDAALLARLLPRASALVAQPVRADYRGLPLGTEQLADRLPADASVVTYPIVRYAGLHPFQVVVHTAYDEGGAAHPLPQPPTVEYHDLRVIAAALGRPGGTALTPDAVRSVAEGSLAELRRRERHLDVGVSAALEHPGAEHMRTVNHPGNPALLAVAAGVAERLRLDPPRDPGRPLLNATRAPIEPAVAQAWHLDPAVVSSSWRVDGEEVPEARLAEGHRAWYAEHPEVPRAIWERHRDTAAVLGLG